MPEPAGHNLLRVALIRLLLLAFNFVVLSSVPRLQAQVGGDTAPYVVGTALLALLNAGLVWVWHRADAGPGAASVPSTASAAIVAIGGVALVVWACQGWLAEIFSVPVDANDADMLVVVQLGIRRFLTGRNPYAMFHVPWEATLPYGPVLWGPYLVPTLLQADVRFVAVFGELVAVVIGAGAAWSLSRRGRALEAAAFLLLAGVVASDPELRHFTSFAHTPSYWPLIPLFIWLVWREHWRSAATVLGVLIVGRTTMVPWRRC